MKRVRLLCAGVAAAVSLTGCGGAKSSGDSGASSVVTSKAVASKAVVSASTPDDDDVLFAQSMIPHHEQAIEMADIALDPKMQSGAAVRAFASKIKEGQGPEVTLLKAFLKVWGKPVSMDTSQGHDMSKMAGMMSVADMTALGAMRGADFDKKWATMMIAHHEGAIEMAKNIGSRGSDAAILQIAASVAKTQTAEITELKALVG